jgi:hypothetical protein
MNEKQIITNNFELIYLDNKLNYDICKDDQVCEKIFIRELYRLNLYNKLKKKLIELSMEYVNKNNIIIDNNNSKDDTFNQNLLLEVLIILIMNLDKKNDPLFNDKSPFDKKILDKYLKNKCITMNKVSVDVIVNIMPKLSDFYIECYNDYNKHKNIILDIKYDINYEIKDNIVNIKLNLDNEYITRLGLEEIKYKDNIKLSLHIFNHLVKLYNTKILTDYKSVEVLDKIVIEYIYMVYMRYYIISSGNMQASVLPSFKKLLKERLNIKIELFGSPLNTSMTNFGSVFYDIEWVFGSIGNYFNTNILKGYYEVNPPFDICFIKNMFDKMTNELDKAEDNKKPLLFFIIFPLSYSKSQKIPDLLQPYIKFNKVINKNDFPYIRYDREFIKTNVSPITDTHIIICHTSYINPIYVSTVQKFNSILKKWSSTTNPKKSNFIKNTNINNDEVNKDQKNIDNDKEYNIIKSHRIIKKSLK